MANPGFSGPDDPRLTEALAAHAELGTYSAVAERLSISYSAAERRVKAAKRWRSADPSIAAAAKAGGLSDPGNLSHFWQIAKDDDGNGYSLFVKNPETGVEESLSEMVKSAISCAMSENKPRFQVRNHDGGEDLLVIDLADVHFLKLCVESETGVSYDREHAIHRVIEGTEALLRQSGPVGRILFVLGNDILHIDGSAPKTTSGTAQDTDGSIYEGWRDAFAALKFAIEACAKVAPVDLIFCPSNHDWVMGWTLAQSLGAFFHAHPHVNSTPYSMSERHRKYYRFGEALIGLTHGDGAKEESLYALMVTEAKSHISETNWRYWLLHHYHHKIRKRRGLDVFLTEKDHIGMTSIHTGGATTEADCQIEYVRSPSAPDSWHDRNGYVNRQGVECFTFSPHSGMKSRFTEWF